MKTAFKRIAHPESTRNPPIIMQAVLSLWYEYFCPFVPQNRHTTTAEEHASKQAAIANPNAAGRPSRDDNTKYTEPRAKVIVMDMTEIRRAALRQTAEMSVLILSTSRNIPF